MEKIAEIYMEMQLRAQIDGNCHYAQSPWQNDFPR